MDYNRYSLTLVWRLFIIFAMLSLLAYLIILPDMHAASILTALLAIFLVFELLKQINKTNQELTRFFDAVKYKDFSQRFNFDKEGQGFTELGDNFTNLLKRLQADRETSEREMRRTRAVIEHVPVPLLSLHNDGKVTLWNNSARRLFASTEITQKEQLADFGGDFSQKFIALRPGERCLTTFLDERMQRKVTLQATEVIFAGQQEKLVSIQDIQNELDAAQLEAWQDLVRVLTHEIMNSITPVNSLAKTAVELIEDVKSQTQSAALVDELQDVTEAVETVASRSDGLMKFVASYRRLTRLPAASRRHIKLQTLFDRAILLAKAQWSDSNISVSTRIEPSGLSAELDTDMVEQLLLNLLQNAGHAVMIKQQGQIELSARLNKRGNVEIDIGDNGDGVPAEIGEEVFVPFFTTKREGSGVGLALTRQVMQAHGGTVSLGTSHLGGAQFSLVF